MSNIIIKQLLAISISTSIGMGFSQNLKILRFIYHPDIDIKGLFSQIVHIKSQ